MLFGTFQFHYCYKNQLIKSEIFISRAATHFRVSYSYLITMINFFIFPKTQLIIITIQNFNDLHTKTVDLTPGTDAKK